MRGMIARAVGATVLAGGVALTGCDRGETKSAIEVKRYYAQKIGDGIDFGLAGHLTASSYDPTTFDLIDVRLDESAERILHARRGEIIVNAQRDTVMISLHDVVVADMESGSMFEIAGVSTDEMPLGFDVVP